MDEEFDTRKSIWPELVGVDFSAAARIIETENPNVKATKILIGSPVILNYDPTRVWVICNTEDKVVDIPRVG
uniref:Uncharacterized protein n=1 Tax=Cucumis sativus TaxID=3659 RepID=A0A0A0L9Z4_CUCSA